MTRKTRRQRHLRDRAQAAQRSLPGDVLRPRRAPLHRADDVRDQVRATGLAGTAAGRHHPQGVGTAGGHHQARQAHIRPATPSGGWRHRELKARTREQYRWLLDDHLIPEFGTKPLRSITADEVRDLARPFGTKTPTVRSHCYGLLRTIMATAASDGKIGANPCVIRGAGTTKRVHTIRPASLPELAKVTQAMPERYAAMILLASWCALRFGELTELRRHDIDLDADKRIGVIRIERAVVRTEDGFAVTTPKSDAGIRDVAIPPHLVPVIQAHLAVHVGPEPDALLFPAHHGGHLAPATLYSRFYAAREAAGRPDLRFHDLRHTGAVLAASTGATIAELMARLGHSTPAAAMRYQHAAQGRDQAIAELMSKIADANP